MLDKPEKTRELMDVLDAAVPFEVALLPAGAVAGWGLHPLESAALSRRTPQADMAQPRLKLQPRGSVNH